MMAGDGDGTGTVEASGLAGGFFFLSGPIFFLQADRVRGLCQLI